MNTLLEPVTVFCLYADTGGDEKLWKALDKHLSQLQRERRIVTLHRRKVGAGSEWAQVLDTYLNEASLILLLISPDFLASAYCYAGMQRAMERYREGTARVVPIILRPVDWRSAPFAHLEVLPTGARAITKWNDRDEAFAKVANGIRQIIEEPLLQQPHQSLLPIENNFEKSPVPGRPARLHQPHMVMREHELAHFESFQQGIGAWLMIVTGLDGSGKSTFLEQIKECCTSNLDLILPINLFETTSHTFGFDRLSIMEAISRCTAPFCDKGAVKTFVETLGRARDSLIKAISTKNDLYKAQSDSVYIHLFSAKIEQNIVEMKRHIQENIFEALIGQLRTFNVSSLQSNAYRLIILLDEWDCLKQDDKRWTIETVIKTLQQRFEIEHAPARCLAVVASRVRFPFETIKDGEYSILRLPNFTTEQSETYLQGYRIKQEFFEYIYQLTQKYPQFLKIVVDTYAELLEESSQLTQGDLSNRFYDHAWNEWIKRKVMKHIDEAWQQVIYKVAFADYFTVWILEKALRLPKDFNFDDFRLLPYIDHKKHTNGYRVQVIHELVREIIRGAEAHYQPDALRGVKKYSKIFARWCRRWEYKHRA